MSSTNDTMNFGVDLLPITTETYNLGSSDKKWNIYGSLTGNASTATTATNLDAAPTLVQTGTSTISLSPNTNYTLTVGGKSVIFKTPNDTKVTQSNKAYSSYTYWRPLVIGARNASTASGLTNTATDTTDLVYTFSNIIAQPSTGTIKATTFDGNATTATTATTATNLTNAPTLQQTGTSTIDLEANKTYTLTVGGKTIAFKMPQDKIYIKNTSELLTTNPFAPDSLMGPYISKIDNGLYAADKRWTVTGTNISSVASLFDGNYESQGVINAGNTGKILIDFDPNHNNSAYFPGYPYGYILVSFYYTSGPQSVSGRVYCNFESHGIGWHDISFSPMADNTNNHIVYRSAHQGYYNISQLEISIIAGSDSAKVTQIEIHLDRPHSGYTPFLSKYQAETLYYNLTAPKFIGALQGTADKAIAANITSTQYGIAYYSNTTGTFAGTGAGTSGQYLKSNGTSAPTWASFPSTWTPSSHTHGNITNDGKIGSTADYAVYTTTGGAITAGSLETAAPSASGNATAFITSVSQNSKGKITATKANLDTSGTWSGNATTATKWYAAQKVYVALGTASKTETIQGGNSNAETIGVDGTLAETNGGTGQSTYTVGDILYCGAANTLSKLSGNTTTTRKFLRSVATTSGTAVAPAWDTVTKTDVGLSNVTDDAQVKASLGTAKGDMLYWSANATPARLAIGTAGYFLKATADGPVWANTTDITALGTITTGTWQGTTVGTGYGGTGVASHTANRLVYSTSATAIQATDKHYASDTQISINSTTAPDSGYALKVNGALETTNLINIITNSRTKDIYFSNGTPGSCSNVGRIMYDIVSATGITKSQFGFIEYSYPSTAGASALAYSENYYLPTANAGLGASVAYNILTDKNVYPFPMCARQVSSSMTFDDMNAPGVYAVANNIKSTNSYPTSQTNAKYGILVVFGGTNTNNTAGNAMQLWFSGITNAGYYKLAIRAKYNGTWGAWSVIH